MKQSTIAGLPHFLLAGGLLRWACLGLIALALHSQAAAAQPLEHQALAQADRPVIVTSIRPLTLIALQVAGDLIAVKELLSPSQDPHHVSLTVSQRRLIDRADLVVWVGPGLESSLAKPLVSKQKDQVLTWLPAQPGHPSASLNHGHGANDPHPWLDPDAALAFGRQLSARLASLFPAHATALAQRQQQFETSLADTVKSLEQRLSGLPVRTFIAEHAAYGPFTERFGLASAGSLTDASGVAKGARNLWLLKNQQTAGCVVVERLPGSKMARQLADDLGVPVVAIDPLGLAVPRQLGYQGLLETVASGFETCLNDTPSSDDH